LRFKEVAPRDADRTKGFSEKSKGNAEKKHREPGEIICDFLNGSLLQQIAIVNSAVLY